MRSILMRKLGFLAAYGLLWIFFFQAGRILFIVCNHHLSPASPAGTMMLSMLNGLRMDTSMAAYLLVPVGLFLSLSPFFRFFSGKRMYYVYSLVMLVPVVIMTVADVPAFAAWGYRLDVTPLRYLGNPGEAMASVSHMPVWGYLTAMLILFLLFGFLFKKLCNRIPEEHFSNRFIGSISLLIVTASLIIPIRGGWQLAPLNQSSVYFSNDNFANQAALNVPWNFMRSLSFLSEHEKNPFEFLPGNEADSVCRQLFSASGPTVRLIDSGAVNPNVIVIIWESLTSKLIGWKEKNVTVLPGLEQLMREGVYFSNVYASGDRTDKGIVAVLSGYPAQPTTSIVKEPRKTASLHALPRFFSERGYESRFYYGGETEFANMKSYLLGAGFDRLTDVNSFSGKDRNSKWGAHDNIVSDTIRNYLGKAAQPFFLTWLSLSSHEPFETPVPEVITGNSDREKFLNSMHFTDSVVSGLISFCKKQPWWDNTVVIILADHGHRIPQSASKADDFRIPMIWLGGALRNKEKNPDPVMSQCDLASTLCRQLNGPDTLFPWSRNMLREKQRPWAYFCFNNGFGFMEPGRHLVYDNTGRRIMETAGPADSIMTKEGMAVQQMTFADYLLR